MLVTRHVKKNEKQNSSFKMKMILCLQGCAIYCRFPSPKMLRSFCSIVVSVVLVIATISAKILAEISDGIKVSLFIQSITMKV